MPPRRGKDTGPLDLAALVRQWSAQARASEAGALEPLAPTVIGAGAPRPRGVRDILTWVLGECPASPLCGRAVGLPTTYDLTYEEAAADNVLMQGRPGGLPVDPVTYPSPQYGEGIQAAISWLRGETTARPIDKNGHSPYATDHQPVSLT